MGHAQKLASAWCQSMLLPRMIQDLSFLVIAFVTAVVEQSLEPVREVLKLVVNLFVKGPGEEVYASAVRQVFCHGPHVGPLLVAPISFRGRPRD